MDGDFSIAALHEKSHLLIECCELLNNQWPRSLTARIKSIEASNENLPASLLLIWRECKVVGHAKISRLPNTPDGCWVESILISPTHRGKGLGRFLMDGCEKFAGERGFKTIYLSTHDQEGFYNRLGFQLCEPICFYGGSTKMVKTGNSNKTAELSLACSIFHEPKEGFTTSLATPLTQQSVLPNLAIPPPPPLPLLPSLSPIGSTMESFDKSIFRNFTQGGKVFMKKKIQ